MSRQYTREFYAGIGLAAGQSARQILPYVLELVHPSSIVDVGCGSGEWLAMARALGVGDVVGVDGEYARAHLKFPSANFIAADLTQMLDIKRTFDMAMSIEVAEHLPPRCASQFVADLTRLAPVVLFGAAVPGQGGVDHINEQWLDYWQDLFAAGGFQMVDCIRRRFWEDPRVVYHSAQNLVLFVQSDSIDRLERVTAAADPLPSRVVHPELFRLRQAPPPSLGVLIRQLPEAIGRTFRARLRALKKFFGWSVGGVEPPTDP